MLLKNKASKPAEKRELVDYLQAEYDLSQRAACRSVDISRSSYQYKPDTNRDRPVIEALKQLAEKEPMYSFGLIFDTLIERFSRTYRTEVVDLHLFSTLTEAREITGIWIRKYHEDRPHWSFGKLTPVEYRLKSEPENSKTEWH